MNIFLKSTAVIVIAVIFSLTISKSAKEFSVLVTLGVCVLVAVAVSQFLTPIISVLSTLADVGMLSDELMRILLKATGIGMLAELTTLICNDAGNSAMGKGVQLLATIVILWCSLPVFTMLLDTVKNLLIVS